MVTTVLTLFFAALRSDSKSALWFLVLLCVCGFGYSLHAQVIHCCYLNNDVNVVFVTQKLILLWASVCLGVTLLEQLLGSTPAPLV